LKITNFDVYQLGQPSSQGSATWAGNSILLKLTTSDGTIGYGEAVPTLRVQPVIQSLHEVARVFKGKDPLDMELNIHEWHKHDFYLPVSFESTTALSAFDIACWDIAGKHFGAPIHQLIGGSFRSSVRVYANGWYDKCVTPEQFGERAKKFAAMGYTALKFDPFGAHYDSIDAKGLENIMEGLTPTRPLQSRRSSASSIRYSWRSLSIQIISKGFENTEMQQTLESPWANGYLPRNKRPSSSRTI